MRRLRHVYISQPKRDSNQKEIYISSSRVCQIRQRLDDSRKGNWLIDMLTPVIDLDRSKGGMQFTRASLSVLNQYGEILCSLYRDETERNPVGLSNGSRRESVESVNIMTAATREWGETNNWEWTRPTHQSNEISGKVSRAVGIYIYPYMYERDREREQQQMDSMAAIPSSIFPLPAHRDVFSCLFPFLLLYLFFSPPVRNNRQSGIAKKRERCSMKGMCCSCPVKTYRIAAQPFERDL